MISPVISLSQSALDSRLDRYKGHNMISLGTQKHRSDIKCTKNPRADF